MLVGMIVIVFVAFSLRLMNYQIVQADEYQQMAQGSYTSVQTIDAPGARFWTAMAVRWRSMRSAMTS